MIMVALVRSWQDLAKILASIPIHLGKRAKIRVTGLVSHTPSDAIDIAVSVISYRMNCKPLTFETNTLVGIHSHFN